MDNGSIIWKIVGWAFGLIAAAIGVVNLFWGNDPFFGAFIILLSFLFFPPVNPLIKKMSGFSVPWFVKVLLGVFIIWAALGVGELFDKIDLMMNDLR